MHVPRLQFEKHPRLYTTLTSILVVVGVVLFAHPAHADLQTDIYNFLSDIVIAVLQTVASLTAVFVHILVLVSQFNSFNISIVKTGWGIIRDVSNMFFIVALLIIAAGTILRLENYRYNRLLVRVVIMAFLVNFSKLIALFFIQSAQVIMLTFVSSYKDALFGNFASMLGLDKVLQFAATQHGVETTLAILMTLLAGLAFMVVAMVVILAICVILVVRVVALWVLVMLSPLAYTLRTIPNTAKYASTWWSEFGKYVVAGPVLAFFLWLSLAVVIKNNGNVLQVDQQFANTVTKLNSSLPPEANPFDSNLLSFEGVISFMIGIVFLIMGLNYAMKSGGAAGQWAGKVATTGFGVAAGVTGLNFVRDRTIAPVQGWIRQRQDLRKAAIAERSAGLGAAVDRGLASTVGQVGRVGAAASATLGGAARGARDVALRRASVQQAIQSTAEAGATGFQEGTRGYRQSLKRAEGVRVQQIAREATERNIKSRSNDELDSLFQGLQGDARLAVGSELANRRRLDAGQARQLEAEYRSFSPEQARAFRKTMNTKNGDVALEAFYNNLATNADADNLLEAIDIDEAPEALILKTRLFGNGQRQANGQLVEQDRVNAVGQRLTEMRKQKGSLQELGKGVDQATKNDFFRAVDFNTAGMGPVDLDERMQFANATGHAQQAFRNAAGIMAADLAVYIARYRDKLADAASEAMVEDQQFMDVLYHDQNFGARGMMKIADRNNRLNDTIRGTTNNLRTAQQGTETYDRGATPAQRAQYDFWRNLDRKSVV